MHFYENEKYMCLTFCIFCITDKALTEHIHRYPLHLSLGVYHKFQSLSSFKKFLYVYLAKYVNQLVLEGEKTTFITFELYYNFEIVSIMKIMFSLALSLQSTKLFPSPDVFCIGYNEMP
jgi:hypothetical protein